VALAAAAATSCVVFFATAVPFAGQLVYAALLRMTPQVLTAACLSRKLPELQNGACKGKRAAIQDHPTDPPIRSIRPRCCFALQHPPA
jgi:hypothetical protein